MANEKNIHIEISTASIAKGMLVILSFFLLYLLRNVVIIFLFALILASAVSPFATWLEKRRIPRVWGVLLLYIVVFGMIIFVSSLVVPSVSNDLSQLTASLPKVLERVTTSLDTVQGGAPKYFDFVSEIQNILNTLSSSLQQFSQSALGIIIGVFGGLFSFLAIIVISLYLAMMKNGIEIFLKSVVPDNYEGYAIGLWKRAELKVGRWLQGQLLLALIVGLAVYVGLSLMNIKFALILGIISMVFEIVPVAGPILAAIPGVFMAFLQSPTLGFWVIVFYIAVQQLENHILVPIVLGKTTGLNPVVVILALLVGTQLAGISGAILAVPIASVGVELLEDAARFKEAHARA